MWIIWLPIVGLIAGVIARAVVPGRDRLGISGTLLLGVVGSLVGGFLGWLIFNHDEFEGAFQLSGLFGSIVGAIVALLIWRQVQARRGRGRGGSRA